MERLTEGTAEYRQRDKKFYDVVMIERLTESVGD